MRKFLGLWVVVIVIIVAVVVWIVIARGGGDQDMSGMNMHGSSQSADQEAKATDQVTIDSYAFNPGTIKVKAGTTVTWTNHDSVHHSVTSDNGSSVKFDSGLFGQAKTYQFTFDKAGTYHYHCTPHPYMHGTVIVTE